MDRKIKKWLIKSHPEIKNAFKNKMDVYAFLASKIFTVVYEDCCCSSYIPTKLQQLYRRAAKMYALNAVCPTVDGMRQLRDILIEIKDEESR